MSFEEHLEVQEAGGFSIIRFRQDINEVGDCAEDMFEAVRRFASANSCLKLAIDVAAHPYLPSSVLSLLIRLHTQEGVEVHLVNAPEAVVEIINITQLNRMLHVNELEIGSWDTGPAGETVGAVALGGYFVDCPSCGAEHRVDKHDLGVRLTCEDCQARHTVSAEMLHDASHVYAECSECHKELRIAHSDLKTVLTCDHCETNLEIRTIV